MTTFESSKSAAEIPLHKRRVWRAFVLVGLIIVAGSAGVSVLVFVFGLGARAQTKVTISKATTYVTGPLRADGTVDYLAALNERCREGVTVDNNASVLFWQASGPLGVRAANREEFFRLLGIPAPPEGGEYFLPLDQFATIDDVVAVAAGETDDDDADAGAEPDALELQDQLDEAMTRPWTEDEFPRLAEWLRDNEAPLALVVQASRRPRRYDPLVAAPDEPYRLVTVDLAMVTQLRDFTRALVVRAMQRAASGRIDEAWDDLMAVHRLARLAAQGPTLIEGLVGGAIEGVACAADRALLAHVELSPRQIARMRADLDQLAPVSPIVDKIDVGERFMLLDTMSTAVDLMAQGTIEEDDDLAALKSISASAVDWDRVFADGNVWFDRYVAACREPNRARREVELAKLDEEFEQKTKDGQGVRTRIAAALGSREAITERVGLGLYNLMLPAMSAACSAQDRRTLDLEVTKLAFALAAYRADHGSYPQKLADLVPGYIAKVPEDVFAGRPISYTLDDEGYILHSFGANGEDDVGAALALDNYGDDIFVLMPLAPGGAP